MKNKKGPERRCDACGKYVSYDDIYTGKAWSKFTPDNHFSGEKYELLCPSCTEKYDAYEKNTRN